MMPTRKITDSAAHWGPNISGYITLTLNSSYHFFPLFRVSKSYSRQDYQYVEWPSEDFFCPATTDLLLQPHLTLCCGRHLSQAAASEIQKKGGKCPLCSTIPLSTILNKHFQREVKRIQVYCDNQCSWQGELSALDYHLQSCPKKDFSLMTKPSL